VDVTAVRCAASLSGQSVSDSVQTFLFVGRFVHQKAPEILIQAIMHLPARYDIRVLFIGEGPLLQELRASITVNNLENRASVLPYKAEWWGLLKTATALVSPSRFEGQPNVVLEAMAAGCPLIVSDIPVHRAILDEHSALIVPRDDPVALTDAIMQHLADPEAACRRAARASECVASFTIQATADAYERVYARVLNGWTV
jgi:glycosyltransferase involved in cell wall biosynthesis